MSGMYCVVGGDGGPSRIGRGFTALGAVHDRRSGPGYEAGLLGDPPTGVQVVEDENSGSVLAWDGVLHAVGRLRRAGPTTDPALSDAALVLASLMWGGRRILADLIGDWSLIFWDARSQRVLAARDAVGMRPLAFAQLEGSLVLASYPQDLVASGAAAAVVDEEYVRRFVGGLPLDSADTGFDGVTALRGGEMLTGGPRSPTVDCWWRPPAKRRFLVDPSEAQAEFNTILTQAVRSRMGAARHSALFLSGGVDSSVLAAHVVAAGGTRVPCITGFSSQHSTVDERRFARAVADELGLEHTLEVDLRDDVGLAKGRLTAESFDQCVVPAQAPMLLHLTEAASGAGARLVIDGNGGDELLDGRRDLVVDLMLAGQMRRLWSMASANRSTPAALRLIAGHVRRSIDLRNRLAGRQTPSGNEFVPDATPPKPPAHSVDAIFRTAAPYRRWTARHVYGPAGVAVTSPLADIRLVEFVLSIQPWLLRHDGWPRALLRCSGEQWLGESVTRRRGKHYFNELLLAGLRANPETAKSALERVSEVDGVEPAALLNCYERALQNTDLASAGRLWPAISAGLWLM